MIDRIRHVEQRFEPRQGCVHSGSRTEVIGAPFRVARARHVNGGENQRDVELTSSILHRR